MIYLACPYSHPDPSVREARFRAANGAAAWLMARGEIVFSPISHSHPIAQQCDLPKDFEFWRRQDEAMIALCDEVAVLVIDGVADSRGVMLETSYAIALGKQVRYLTPEDMA